MNHSKMKTSQMHNTHNTYNTQNMHNTNHYLVMFIIMILSGLLTTMNIYADKLSDIRLSLNDLYMTLVMTGWMFAFMGIFYKNIKILACGILLVLFNIWAIRTQFMITQNQYLLGMIPHHSMAVHMSKKLLEKRNNKDIDNKDINIKNNSIKGFLENIVNTQNDEIEFMKLNL